VGEMDKRETFPAPLQEMGTKTQSGGSHLLDLHCRTREIHVVTDNGYRKTLFFDSISYMGQSRNKTEKVQFVEKFLNVTTALKSFQVFMFKNEFDPFYCAVIV
jgi:hypothetical protein